MQQVVYGHNRIWYGVQPYLTGVESWVASINSVVTNIAVDAAEYCAAVQEFTGAKTRNKT